MMKSARLMLVILLRAAGCAMSCAVFFVFCPFAWMSSMSEWLGMGDLSYSPLASYLVRTLSAMYAIEGALFLFVSLDVERYGPLIRFAGWIAILAGAGVTILDGLLGLPIPWTLTEGPLTTGMGVAMVVLARRARL